MFSINGRDNTHSKNVRSWYRVNRHEEVNGSGHERYFFNELFTHNLIGCTVHLRVGADDR